MNKILIIGKNSFIGSNLKKYLSKEFKVKNLSFEDIINKKVSFFSEFSHVINTTIHKKYIYGNYNKLYDLDRKFVSRFKKISFTYIFLNSRKIYFQKENISENSFIKPISNYGRNKFKTETFLKKKLKTKLLSLRISNIIGRRIIISKRNHHKLFFDNFLAIRNYKKKIIIADDYKDFLSIIQFCKIITDLISQKINGIYNVSLSQKVYVSELVKWIDKKFYNKISFTDNRKDSFTLSNKKLLKKICVKPTKYELKKFCKKILK